MSLPVPSGPKPLTDEDLALLATSPTWAQSPSGWFDRPGNDEDTQAAQPAFGSPTERQMDHPGFVDDFDDGLPLSMELRGSDAENVETIHPHYWDQLFTPDERGRKVAMTRLSRGLKNLLNLDSVGFEHAIPRLSRLLSECPFVDVHDWINDMMQMMSKVREKEMNVLGVSGPVVPRVSRMFKESVLAITTGLEPQASLFKASFLNTGRVTHMYRIMAWHPSFLERHTESYDFLLRAEGPLPFPWRHYLAILSASRFKCDYLVRQQEQEYILAGGDETWLENPQLVPAKLRALLEVNALLAHQPWRLQPSHIALLTKCADPSARWSVGELVHAFIILATFRALSGLAIGMGIHHEVDLSLEYRKHDPLATSDAHSAQTTFSPFQHTSQSTLLDEFPSELDVDLDSDLPSDSVHSSSNLSSSDPSLASTADSPRRSPQNTEQLTSRLATRAARSSEEGDEPKDAEQRKHQFELAGDNIMSGPYYPSTSSSPTNTRGGVIPPGAKNGSQSSGNVISGVSSVATSGNNGQTGKSDRFWKYNEPYEVSHTDFDVKTKEYSVFHIQDWSWEEHAFELIERVYNKEFAQLLDTEFTTIFELTYHNVNGQTGIDTAPFRRSIWYYVHRIHGILHDDYNYATVNELLLRNLKKFTKDLSCTPFAVTPQDLLNLGYSLSPEEKCHIALLATEARKQAELMYALHALSKHISSA